MGLALDHGINVVDTDECYLQSEERLGQALQGRRGDVSLFTKCGLATAATVKMLDRLWNWGCSIVWEPPSISRINKP